MTLYLCFDISNLLYRTFYANKNEDAITISGLAMHQALLTLNKYFKEYPANKIVMAFDRPNWRKVYTKTDTCVSGKIYKGNRRKDMSQKEEAKYKSFLDHLTDFERLMKEHTSVICLAAVGLEADDLVGGFCQNYTSNENEIIVVSTDKDFLQVLSGTNVRLINPADGKPRTLDEWEGNADLFMYEKAIRGDAGDNVQSAYPRVRKTRIMKAWNDPVEHVNMMNETWTNQDGKEFIVKDLFKENELLMDLRKQPEGIRELINETIDAEMADPGSYSYFEFLRFCGKYGLKKVAEQAEKFAPMLSR